MGQSPNSQFGPVFDADLTEKPEEVFLDCAFREVEFICYFFIKFGLAYKLDNLFFPKTEAAVEGNFHLQPGPATGRTDSVRSVCPELATTAVTASYGARNGYCSQG